MRYLLLALLFFACQPEKIVYIEIPVDSEQDSTEEIIPTPIVKANVTSSSNTTVNGVKFITARGKVINRGPGQVWSVRIVLTSDDGYSRTVVSSPSLLEEGEWGNWNVSNLQGSYIRFKDVLFSYGN